MEQEQKKFEPRAHLIQIKTKWGSQEYLKVQWRLVWFREVNPHGDIETQLVQLDLERGFALFKAIVTDGQGGTASGHGSETRTDFDDYIEKAETKAVGRGLAMLGYGTQFTSEFDEEERIVDSPVSGEERVRALPPRPVNQTGVRELPPRPPVRDGVRELPPRPSVEKS